MTGSVITDTPRKADLHTTAERAAAMDAVITHTQQGPLLGYLVMWRISGLSVTHGDLSALLTGAGLGPFLPKPPSAHTAMRRALIGLVRARAAAGLGARLSFAGSADLEEGSRALVRALPSKGSDDQVFALVQEDIDFLQLGLKYGTKLRIRVHKQTGAWIVTTTETGAIDAVTESQAFARALDPHWARARDRLTSGDLARLVRTLVDATDAVSMREQGGVYFVPADQAATLEAIAGFLAAIPAPRDAPTYFLRIGVADTVAQRIQLARATFSGLQDELGVLTTELDTLLTRNREAPGTVRARTIADKLRAYKLARVKVSAYGDLLDHDMGVLHAQLDTLHAQAEAVLDQIEAAD